MEVLGAFNDQIEFANSNRIPPIWLPAGRFGYASGRPISIRWLQSGRKAEGMESGSLLVSAGQIHDGQPAQ